MKDTLEISKIPRLAITFEATKQNDRTYIYIDSKQWVIISQDENNIVLTEHPMLLQMQMVENKRTL